MNVYYIGGNYDSCYYVRCLVPLRANLWDGDQTSLKKKYVDQSSVLKGIMNADVVVFHRPMIDQPYELAQKLKKLGKKIVMDNDDTYIKDGGVPIIMERIADNGEEYLDTIDKKLKRFAELADMVTVSTDFLKKEYDSLHNNVVVINNCVDSRDWYEKRQNDTGKVRIGIVGSVASNKDYEQLKPFLESTKGNKDIQLVLFALPPKTDETKLAVELYKPEFDFWSQYNPEWHHFVPMSDYQKKLADLKLDIMLIPRHNSYFNRCKSNLKFLESSMLKIPVIAQSFSDGMSPYEQDSEDASHMILCKTEEDWTREITNLVENKELRELMGAKAYEYVKNKYDIKNNKHKWADAYQTLWNQNESSH